jgi:hypothetical protein
VPLKSSKYIGTYVIQITNCIYILNKSSYVFRLIERTRRVETQTLLKGVELPAHIQVAKGPLTEPRQCPSTPVEHGHTAMEFPEPDNREGEAVLRHRMAKDPHTASLPVETGATGGAGSVEWQGPYPQQPYWFGEQPWPGWFGGPGWPPYQHQQSYPTPPAPTPAPPPPPYTSASYGSMWRTKKAEKEDWERQERGEPPIKRYRKNGISYQCTKCQLPKTKDTGHTQYKGNWFCPSSDQSLDDWRKSVKKK